MVPIIEIKDLSKKYVIRHQATNSYPVLRDVIMQKAKNILQKVTRKEKTVKTREEFWALKDINLEIAEGQRLGIIGRNGAGKSTLLKILSRITAPTTGKITIRGRVSSLLEVGTGFHPELTGRENIFLNGAILGMSRVDIRKNFEDIVDFAEVRNFLDTPVKHYSSGMYVRLAFAVAAHLQPEILIIDEVLAVGDVQFQKKCLGKMAEVSKSGRTVLFVSHNMGAILQLCDSVVLLNEGKIVSSGDPKKVVSDYINSASEGQLKKNYFEGPLTPFIEFHEILVNDVKQEGLAIHPSSEIKIKVKGVALSDIKDFRTLFSIYKDDLRLFSTHDCIEPKPLPKGDFEAEIVIPAYFLRPGNYSIGIGGYEATGRRWSLFGMNLKTFEIIEDWSIENQFNDHGIINIPLSFQKRRRKILTHNSG